MTSRSRRGTTSTLRTCLVISSVSARFTLDVPFCASYRSQHPHGMLQAQGHADVGREGDERTTWPRQLVWSVDLPGRVTGWVTTQPAVNLCHICPCSCSQVAVCLSHSLTVSPSLSSSSVYSLSPLTESSLPIFFGRVSHLPPRFLSQSLLLCIYFIF